MAHHTTEREIGGHAFREVWLKRKGSNTLLCYVDGKLTARKLYKAKMAEAEATEVEK